MKLNRNIKGLLVLLLVVFSLTSCEDFFEPMPSTVVKEDDFFANDADFRTAEMGLYAIQQELVEQLVVLGELRGDLLEVTENANADLLEVYNFNISTGNKYASPVNFYKLIANCNKLLTKIELKKPEVLDMSVLEISNYDRMHASVLAMRAWAYFNAVRIYGRIPYIPSSLTRIEDIRNYVDGEAVEIERKRVDYVLVKKDTTINGVLYNTGMVIGDTIVETISMSGPAWLDKFAVLDTLTNQLETGVKYSGKGIDREPAVGVNYNIEEGVNDPTWEITTWNVNAYYCLLGQLFLESGDLRSSERYFDHILRYTSNNSDNKDRYKLLYRAIALPAKMEPGKDPDDKLYIFREDNYVWANKFSSLDLDEHILAVDFGKSERQQNELQRMFSAYGGNQYMMKPTKGAVFLWENDEWTGWRRDNNSTANNYEDDFVPFTGWPGDFRRGNGLSYAYHSDGVYLTDEEVSSNLDLWALGKDKEVLNSMVGVDTVVYKYTFRKTEYDRDADFCIYRAAGIHLYMAEIYNRLINLDKIGATETQTAISIVTGGFEFMGSRSMGVRGRVSLQSEIVPGANNDLISRNPYTGELVEKGDKVYDSYLGGLLSPSTEIKDIAVKRKLFEEYVLKERAKELAFEGERFYDIMRVAERRGDPSFLADRISSQYRGEQRRIIRAKLMNPENWYVPFDLGIE